MGQSKSKSNHYQPDHNENLENAQMNNKKPIFQEQDTMIELKQWPKFNVQASDIQTNKFCNQLSRQKESPLQKQEIQENNSPNQKIQLKHEEQIDSSQDLKKQVKNKETQNQELKNEIQNLPQNKSTHEWNSIKTALSEQKNLTENLTLQIKPQETNLQKKSFVEQLLSTSKIIKTENEVNDLIQMFGSVKIQTACLLYRASSNSFSASKYLEKFGLQTHVMWICQTNKDKMIGFYTPISLGWCENDKNQDSNWSLGADETRKSFMFSLTHNDRFQLVDQQHVVFRSKRNDKIVLGLNDLILFDNSNQNNSCYAFVNNPLKHSFFSKNYDDFHNIESNKRFTGNETLKFLTKEWQMWKITPEKLQ